MKENLDSKVEIKNGQIEISVFAKEEAEGRYGEPYPSLDEQKRKLEKRQYGEDARELQRETLRERLKHHQDAVSNLQAEIDALEKDMKEDESDVNVESKAASEKQKEARKKFMEMIKKKKGGDKKADDKEKDDDKDDEKKPKKKEASKGGYEKIDEKELKRDTKKQKMEHEKDAISDDKSKIKKLEKGKPSAKKSREKRDLKKDIKYDKDSKQKMEADYGDVDSKKMKPKKTYAQILMDIAAERFGGKKRSQLKDSDFLDPKRRSFPVMSAQDVKDAVSSWGRYKGSMTFDEFKAKLTRRAKKIGAESALPKSWTDEK
jgi:chromosome segregation ATPase|tara:strand:+ start:3613 stop:4566 length:954 start_codon:yes stop_codon:yes gene_type:complete